MIVLDTHAWLWWLSAPEKLSPPARLALRQSPAVGVSTLSVWEIGLLVQHGRIELDRDVRDWVRSAFNSSATAPLSPDPEVALAAAALSARDFPGDPADRFIYATARSLNAPLLTRDERIRRFDPEGTIW